MVASTNSNGIGRPLMRTKESSIDNRNRSGENLLDNFDSRVKNSPNANKENYECPQCGKRFGNQQILQLHTGIHKSQSLLRDVPGAAATLLNTTHFNGILSFNFNVTLDISANDYQERTLKERLTDIFKSESLWENVSQTLADVKCSSETENVKTTAVTDTTVHETQRETQDCGSFSQSTEKTLQHIDQASDAAEKEVEINRNSPNQPVPSPLRTQHISRGRKAVGLTKIRMEDCRRCDACSCIYMDERDYIKHMKNFHKHDVESIQLGAKEELNFRPFRHKQDSASKRLRQTPSPPQKKSCRSCCKQCKCRGKHSHTTLQPMLPILRPVLGRQTNRALADVLPSDIKDRWTKVVTQRLSDSTRAVPEPGESDISHLLSQVEVKIKTEPIDLIPPSICAEETEGFIAIKEERPDAEMLEF